MPRTRAYPWKCRACSAWAVRPDVVPYSLDMRYGGVLHRVTIDALNIPTCYECGEKVFTVEVDEQLQKALEEMIDE